MVTGISSSAATHALQTVELSARKPTETAASTGSSTVHDTVTLSQAAQRASSASGDVDHDGDSH